MISKKTFKFTQVFGDKQFSTNVSEPDVITALSFEKQGRLLAIGDESGRLIVFEQSIAKNSSRKFPEYKYLTEWQSHLREFDYLKSVDIHERITGIEWLESSGKGKFILATNEKKIRLWKLSDRKITISEKIPQRDKFTLRSLPLPLLRTVDGCSFPSLKRTFATHHNFHIHSISASPDGESFISSDELRINLWNLENPAITFNILDIKPRNIDDVTEVITKSKFHPFDDCKFIYATNKGCVCLGDLRENSKLINNVLKFENSFNQDLNAFREVTSSISDASISPDGRFIYARDYLSIKIWDVNNPSRPLNTVKLYDASSAKLRQLYENDSMLDQFSVEVSPCSKYVVTGGYNNQFQVVDKRGKRRTAYEVNFNRKTMANNLAKDQHELFPNTIHNHQKILKTAWNPSSDCLAVANANCLFFFHA